PPPAVGAATGSWPPRFRRSPCSHGRPLDGRWARSARLDAASPRRSEVGSPTPLNVARRCREGA
ncbi:hypothetical protein NL676_007134, partial [Syzygium grande]